MKLLFAFSIAVLLLCSSTIGATSMSQTWTIQNGSSYGLGIVTVTYSSGAEQVTVAATGSYPVSLPTAALSVTINGQTVSNATTATVVLANGVSVKVSWPSTNVIQVTTSDNVQ
jgi:hypothetical protein